MQKSHKQTGYSDQCTVCKEFGIVEIAVRGSKRYVYYRHDRVTRHYGGKIAEPIAEPVIAKGTDNIASLANWF